MSTADRPNLLLRLNRSRWTVPVFAVVFGVTVFAIQAANGDPAAGVVSLGIMLGYAGVLWSRAATRRLCPCCAARCPTSARSRSRSALPR